MSQPDQTQKKLAQNNQTVKGESNNTTTQGDVKNDAHTSESPDIQTVNDSMPGKYLVKVVRSKCIGAGPCTAVAPSVFQLDDENIARVISQNELDDIKLLAAQSCPVSAIIVEDLETGERVWPPQGE